MVQFHTKNKAQVKSGQLSRMYPSCFTRLSVRHAPSNIRPLAQTTSTASGTHSSFGPNAPASRLCLATGISSRIRNNATGRPLYEANSATRRVNMTRTMGQVRGYVATAGNVVPQQPVHVDQVLKKFYKTVHPDLFAMEPEKRGYLDLMREGQGRKAEASEIAERFTLSFYTKNLEKPVSVEVSLPPGRTQQKQKDRHLSATLHNLFRQCKFSYEPFYVSTTGKEAERYARPGDLTLVNFLLKTVANINPRTQKKSALQEKVDTEAKMAAYLQQQLAEVAAKYNIAKFAFNVREHLFLLLSERYTARIGLIYRLKQALEEAPGVDVSGAIINFTAKETGVDINGHICLNHKGTAQQWAQYFTSYSKDEANALVEKEKARSEMEKSITEMLKISSWSADPEISSDFAYRSLLSTTIGAIRRKNWEFPASVQELKVRVEKIKDVDYHPGTGTLMVPWEFSPRDIHESISVNCKQILNEKKQYLSQVDYIREKLGLKELTFLPYPELTFDQLHECMNRLNNHQSMIKPYTQGLKIVVGHEYGFNPESGTVAIRWDYLIDKP